MNYSFLVPSMLILIVIMGYYFFRPRLPIRLNRAFLAILVIHICTELFEALSCRLDETWPEHSLFLLWSVKVLFFVFSYIRPYMILVFTVSIMDAKILKRSPLYVLAPIVYAPCVVIALTNPLTHLLFWYDRGLHTGRLYWTLFACSTSYQLFAAIAVIRHRKELSSHEIISLLSIQGILVLGNLVRFLMPGYIIMNTFVLMAILVIFISFQNPDMYLSERGSVYNMPAFEALLEECHRKKRPCRVLGFVLQNYTEHREIFGGKQMNEAMITINKWLVASFPSQSSFYLRSGCYAMVGTNRPNLAYLRDSIAARFTEPWKTGIGELKLSVAFVEADMEDLDCPADRLLNTMLISLDEMGHSAEHASSRSLSDSIEEINRKIDIRRCLEYALDHNRLEVFLQPLMDSHTGKRVAAES